MAGDVDPTADDAEALRSFYALERWFLERVSTRVVPSAFGVAYLDDDFPTRYYSNFLLVDRRLEDASVDGLID